MKLYAAAIFLSILTSVSFADVPLDIYMPNKENNEQQSRGDFESILLPPENDFSVGKVVEHDTSFDKKNCIFIVGPDETSIQWLSDNNDFLKNNYCIGIITHVHQVSEIEKIDKSLDVSLIPINIDGYEKILGTSHYPLVVIKGRVMQ